MQFNITTGYGYVLNGDGTFNYKYAGFVAGSTNFPDGVTVVEVPDQNTLDTLPICNPPPNKDAQLAAMDAVYQPQFNDLANAYMIALMNNDTATMSDIKSEYYALQTQYNTQKTGIENA